MIAPYEIYQKLEARQVCWVESATSLNDAKARLKDLATIFPGDYFIFDVANGVFLVPAEDFEVSQKL